MLTRTNAKNNLLTAKLTVFLMFILFGIAAFLFYRSQKSFLEEIPSTLDVRLGATLPDLKLLPLEGPTTQLSAFHSKLVLLLFWASWCDSCLKELPTLVHLQRSYSPADLQILTVNLDENPNQTLHPLFEAFKLKKLDLNTLLIFQDPKAELAQILNINGVPVNFLLDHNRKLLKVIYGKYDWNSQSGQTELNHWINAS